jgi:hypothetical protein
LYRCGISIAVIIFICIVNFGFLLKFVPVCTPFATRWVFTIVSYHAFFFLVFLWTFRLFFSWVLFLDLHILLILLLSHIVLMRNYLWVDQHVLPVTWTRISRRWSNLWWPSTTSFFRLSCMLTRPSHISIVGDWHFCLRKNCRLLISNFFLLTASISFSLKGFNNFFFAMLR